jgi:hypothetical protein
VLTDAERKRMFDMAMEMHELQRRATEVSTAMGPFNTRLGELSRKSAARPTFRPISRRRSSRCRKMSRRLRRSLHKLAAVAVAAAVAAAVAVAGEVAGRRQPVGAWVRRRTASWVACRSPTPSCCAYTEAKTQLPKAIADANSLFTRAATLSSALTKHNLTLTAPTPVK